jgi:hypothetical protein
MVERQDGSHSLVKGTTWSLPKGVDNQTQFNIQVVDKLIIDMMDSYLHLKQKYILDNWTILIHIGLYALAIFS